MKSQTSQQTREKKSPAPVAHRSEGAVPANKSSSQPRSSFDDLHARITARAYELYAERGYRDGYALEDWVEAEREIVNRQFPS